MRRKVKCAPEKGTTLSIPSTSQQMTCHIDQLTYYLLTYYTAVLCLPLVSCLRLCARLNSDQ